MTEKKKYEAPEMKVFQVKQTSIICISVQSQTEALLEEEYTWQ